MLYSRYWCAESRSMPIYEERMSRSWWLAHDTTTTGTGAVFFFHSTSTNDSFFITFATSHPSFRSPPPFVGFFRLPPSFSGQLLFAEGPTTLFRIVVARPASAVQQQRAQTKRPRARLSEEADVGVADPGHLTGKQSEAGSHTREGLNFAQHGWYVLP